VSGYNKIKGKRNIETLDNVADVTNSNLHVQVNSTGGNAWNINPSGQGHVVLSGTVSQENSTIIPLATSGVFTGSAIDTLDYSMINISVFADKSSATDGLSIQQSCDGTNWDITDDFTIYASTGKTYSMQNACKYYRLVYTNGTATQNQFRLATLLKKNMTKPSSHRINDPIVDQDDAELTKSVLSGESELTETFENISSYRKALNVNSAWVHRKIVNESFHQDTGDTTTLNTGASEGDTTLDFTSTLGFSVDSEIKLTENSTQEVGLMTITNIAGSIVTLDRPIGSDYTTSATIAEVSSDMAVNGSLGSPQIFEVTPPSGTIWQLTRILFSIFSPVAPDDGKFGGITALTNGVSLRATTEAGRTVVFGNWKTNGDMKLDMYDVTYSDKAPAGDHGVNGRWTFTKSEVVAELDGDASPIQKMEILIQDNLTTLDGFKMRAQGRVFSP
jgi:hypothetical protein